MFFMMLLVMTLRDLIETSWNVKESFQRVPYTLRVDLIETSWNVKSIIIFFPRVRSLRFNRNIVECKVVGAEYFLEAKGI